MRKLLLSVSILLIFFIAGVYLFIPHQIKVSRLILIGANQNTVYRSVTEKEFIDRWWKEGGAIKANSKPVITLNDFTFTIRPQMFDIAVIHIQRTSYELDSYLRMLPMQGDS